MKSVFKYISVNRLELLITLCILSNLFGFFLPRPLYYIGLVLIGYKMTKCNVRYNKKKANLFVMFILFIFISSIASIVNMMFDLRLVLFCYILIVTCPIYTSLRWHLFKKGLMGNFFIGFVVVVLVNMYAKLTDFSLQPYRC